MSKSYRKNILIICEGEGTEPDYFNEIRNILLSENVDVFIEIKPRPKAEAKEEEFKVRIGGKKRKIKKPEIVLPISEIEDIYKAQPTRYVREAQIGLEEDQYDEVWAVFDKDGHPNHEEAFELAKVIIRGKKVNIAFNSIAFEYWILLHFENSTKNFSKSMCRKGKEPLYCGSSLNNEDNCKGDLCVCGRIATQGYLAYENDKKSFSFKSFHHNVKYAIQNAIQLRKTIANINPIYDKNPYTDTDKLVFKLLNLNQFDLFWFEFNKSQVHNVLGLEIEFNNKNPIIEIHITKVVETSVVLNEDLFCLFNIDGDKLDVMNRKVLQDNQFVFSLDLSIINFNYLYLGVRKSEMEYLITELPI
ncbi:RloB family protein [Flavobacterium piscis]|uniref:RloB domain-containing protein n=1 Tax=Flavobacterium piscis TaxID=1114874 RepID=A0ABU1YEQ6_9FLAO|nr:RloB family protein [Flavobacterium piscis]MDR7212110.1 hypothetical protein [Flavobacterium piscis]